MGDVLADYEDGGGVVVVGTFAWDNRGGWLLQGRWVTGGYSPYDSTSTTLFTTDTATITDPSHPLMQGVSSLTAFYRNGVTLTSGAASVAVWTDGPPAVAYQTNNGHTAVGLNAYLGFLNQFSGEWGRTIVNAGRWLSCTGNLNLLSAASVKGLFAIDLPLSGLSGVEDRGNTRNGRYLIVMTFNNEITSASNATVSCGPDATATATIDPSDAHKVNVSLVGVKKRCSESDVVITADVSDGTDSITASATMGLLIGDVNGDRVVDQSDIHLARSYRGQTTDGTNFRADINDNGRIESSDVGLVKENQGDSL